MSKKENKLINRIKDRMLIGTVYDQMMLKLKYNDEKTGFLYGVMTGQKHRMIFYRRYKKRYLKKCTNERPWETLPKTGNSNTVFIMWLQGIENAPEIVKGCIESQKRFLPDKKFVFLDENNFREYAELPDFIMEKRSAGLIGHAHFSDLVRNAVLIKNGGYWIDATVYLTDGELFKDIDKLPLFMPSYYYFGFNPEIMELNNWLIYSSTNNNMLCLLQEMLYSYWKDYDRAQNYFVYHIMESIVNDYYKEEFKAIPIVSQAQAHVLATYIYDKFDEEKYAMLKKTTGIHKLSTRFEQDKLKEGTFYDFLFRRNAE